MLGRVSPPTPPKRAFTLFKSKCTLLVTVHPLPTPASPTQCPPGIGRRLWHRALTLDVQITSRRLMFIQLSQLTRCPL